MTATDTYPPTSDAEPAPMPVRSSREVGRAHDEWSRAATRVAHRCADAGHPAEHPASALLPATLTGGLTELAWVGAHVLMYPLGTRVAALRPDVRKRPGQQPPTVRALFAADPLAARIPVLLVHGLVDNRSVFSVMERSLRRRGFAHVCTWNYSPS
ncbi:hypothetical protein [Blastococcus brunescens]|uniref:Uncharacterized protein n=1 Tax=Blastococcus brunescens TaxID=1564165 RepID=A0ABZ1AX30_9ACTN|nr:hypothetical protein [Blastococcus sp. BMG 8361]WRL63014.1 hypothetical protein U6N30_24670 [Blastococcus sp. BMG 8361]